MLLAVKRNTLPGPQQQLRCALYLRPDGRLLSHNIMPQSFSILIASVLVQGGIAMKVG